MISYIWFSVSVFVQRVGWSGLYCFWIELFLETWLEKLNGGKYTTFFAFMGTLLHEISHFRELRYSQSLRDDTQMTNIFYVACTLPATDLRCYSVLVKADIACRSSSVCMCFCLLYGRCICWPLYLNTSSKSPFSSDVCDMRYATVFWQSPRSPWTQNPSHTGNIMHGIVLLLSLIYYALPLFLYFAFFLCSGLPKNFGDEGHRWMRFLQSGCYSFVQ